MIYKENLNKSDLLSLLKQVLSFDTIDTSTEELLDYINMTKQQKKEQELLKQHIENFYHIWQNDKGIYLSYLPAADKPKGRKPVTATTQEKLERKIIDFYLQQESKQDNISTLRNLYPQWLRYKNLETNATTYIRRIDTDWKKYYVDDTIIDKDIRRLTKADLKEWALTKIRTMDLTKRQYYNMSVIIRQCLDYAADHGMISVNPYNQFKVDLYEDEVFVFTPKGDLFKLAKGSTVLDFAFHIHSKLGCKCIGAKVNGKNVQLKQMLHSGDQVEIMTSNTQTPKQDWLNIVTTSKARTKIRQALKEMAARQHAFAKETLERKFKNRKIEYDEGTMMRLIKRLGFKIVTDFYQAIADEELDVNEIIDKYQEQQRRENDTRDDIVYRSAEGYNLQQGIPEEIGTKEDVLVIDQNLKGLDFKLARCCNPIYGDDVFGFVSVTGGIKIHRCDCPNASDLHSRFGYRIVKARWAGKSQGTQYPITLRVVGHDDIGIVTNITSIISKETGITLRSIGIDSHDGLFSGTLTIMVSDTGHLEALVKKLRTVKGVKQVSRN